VAVEPQTLLAILAMALGSYATRAGGLWLMRRIKLSSGVEAWLNHLPGAIIAAVVAPGVLAAGPAEALAGLATVVVAARTRSLPLAMLVGVGMVWGMRMVI